MIPLGALVLALADVTERATITVEEAAQILGIGRSAAYEAVARGQLPIRRIGRRIFVPVPALMAWLGSTEAEAGSPAGSADGDSA